ncbi:MAG: hypothetical protein OXN94_08200 [Chloroflexota bacterium]|nr:hypothetical protein [Chloroflexota bacterium]MDE2857817.1 hypothetical protein [Chloroflexota bacterium]MDE2950960.1 hypothetical protein [Chloroflexota bacterium]
MAGRQGIELSQELIKQADAEIENGEATISQRDADELNQQAAVIPLEERLAGNQEFLAELACTPERIAAE